MVSPLVLEAPDVPSQAGVDPFAGVAEGMGVIPISDLPGGGRYAGIGGVRLADLMDGGPVQGVGVFAPGPLHPSLPCSCSWSCVAAAARTSLTDPKVL